MWETLAGGLLGGVFRAVPEILKFFDAKNERGHELSMQDKAFQFQKLKGNQKVEEIQAQGQVTWDTGALEALKSSIAAQAVQTGVKWIDALSSSVRPTITYWFMLLFCLAKVAMFTGAINAGAGWIEAINIIWTSADQALFAGILNFWFLGRVFDKSLR